MRRVIDRVGESGARDVLRAIGGLLVGVALLVIAIRRGSPEEFGDETSRFGLFLVVGAAAFFLYGTGIAAARIWPTSVGVWSTVFTSFGVLLIPVAVYLGADAIDQEYDPGWVTIVAFGLATVAGVLAWLLTRARFTLLVAGVSIGIAFLGLLDKLFSDGLEANLSDTRALLLIFAVVLAGSTIPIGKRIDDPDHRAQAEIFTGAAVLAFVALTIGVGGAGTLASSGVSPTDVAAFGGPQVPGVDVFWDLVTLVIGLALILFATRTGWRGPGYVGTAILFLFIYSVGLDLDDSSPEGKVVGWPLLLLIGGLVAFLASLKPDRRDPFGLDGGSVAPAAAPAAAAAPDEPAPAPPSTADEPPTDPDRTETLPESPDPPPGDEPPTEPHRPPPS